MILVITIVSIIFTVILCLLYMKYTKRKKYAKECVNWSCNQLGQICKPDSPGADNKTWICDGATWHEVVNPKNIQDDKNDKNRYAKECNDWSCNQPRQLCPPHASGAEGRTWICDGETWHQAVKPY